MCALAVAGGFAQLRSLLPQKSMCAPGMAECFAQQCQRLEPQVIGLCSEYFAQLKLLVLGRREVLA